MTNRALGIVMICGGILIALEGTLFLYLDWKWRKSDGTVQFVGGGAADSAIIKAKEMR